MVSKQTLVNFEKWVVETYKKGKLRSPVHLSGGNEKQLEKIFKKIKPHDWVFSTYRSHYHALLKGVPKKDLQKWILENKSIHFMSKNYRIWTSAIVGGTLPIALGVAMAIKAKAQKRHVWCFVGDMTAETGGFYEVWKYAFFHKLPITFIIEDNGLSTDTPTQDVWNKKEHYWANKSWATNIIYYKYKRTYPHYGVGVFVDFKDDKLKQDGKSF